MSNPAPSEEVRKLALSCQYKCADEISPLISSALRAERERVLEEIAVFAETHYCVIDRERGPQFYKTEKRESKHPHEPFAMAIRALAAKGATP